MNPINLTNILSNLFYITSIDHHLNNVHVNLLNIIKYNSMEIFHMFFPLLISIPLLLLYTLSMINHKLIHNDFLNNPQT